MRYLGLDLGKKSLGLAISDRTGTIASFYKNIKYVDENKLIDELISIINKESIDALVLGFPKNMNNTIGERGEKTIKFQEKLEKATNLKVELWDERLSTVAAENLLLEADLSRQKRKTVIDKMAAVYILQGYLDSKQL